VYPGVGWVIWRAPEYLPKELVFNINYLGADQASFTLNFSKGASQVIGQYYQLIRFGKQGYRSIMSNLTRIADYLSDQLEELDFVIMSERHGEGLPLVAFRFKTSEEGCKERHYDEFSLANQLRSRSWVVPAYTMAPHTKDMKMLRVVVREDFSRPRCDLLLQDIKLAMSHLQATDASTIKQQEEFLKKHMSSSHKATHTHAHYKVGWCHFSLDIITDRHNHRRSSIHFKARPARRTLYARPSTPPSRMAANAAGAVA
jgi:glutamate decarboxylase